MKFIYKLSNLIELNILFILTCFSGIGILSSFITIFEIYQLSDRKVEFNTIEVYFSKILKNFKKNILASIIMFFFIIISFVELIIFEELKIWLYPFFLLNILILLTLSMYFCYYKSIKINKKDSTLLKYSFRNLYLNIDKILLLILVYIFFITINKFTSFLNIYFFLIIECSILNLLSYKIIKSSKFLDNFNI